MMKIQSHRWIYAVICMVVAVCAMGSVWASSEAKENTVMKQPAEHSTEHSTVPQPTSASAQSTNKKSSSPLTIPLTDFKVASMAGQFQYPIVMGNEYQALKRGWMAGLVLNLQNVPFIRPFESRLTVQYANWSVNRVTNVNLRQTATMLGIEARPPVELLPIELFFSLDGGAVVRWLAFKDKNSTNNGGIYPIVQLRSGFGIPISKSITVDLALPIVASTSLYYWAGACELRWKL